MVRDETPATPSQDPVGESPTGVGGTLAGETAACPERHSARGGEHEDLARENGQPVQQGVELARFVPCVRVRYLPALGEQGVRLVDEEDGTRRLGLGRDLVEMAPGLPAPPC